MTRALEADVRGIITIEDDKDIGPFLATANLYVTEVLGSSGLSAPRLKDIERWLAAHFIAIEDPTLGMLVEDQAGASRERYSSAGYGEGLKMTRYGQQAMVLDTTGVLAKASSAQARFTVVTSL